MIVSFPLDAAASESLTLLRTPKYEFILDESERGVSVATGETEEGDRELLVLVEWGKETVRLESTAGVYVLDVSSVDAAEVNEAKAVLRKMNFDGRFKFT